MKIQTIEVAYVGPFAMPTLLRLDPRVTVLTGANDTGKSSVLRAIQLGFSNDAAEGHEINQERIDSFSGRSQDDADIVFRANIEVADGDVAAGFIDHAIILLRSRAPRHHPFG